MKLRNPDLQDLSINPEHEALGIPPVEYAVTHASDHPVLRLASYLVMAALSALVIFLIYRLFWGAQAASGTELIVSALHNPTFWSALGVGLLAQVIDGALGMAYGITATSFLLASGASPAMASGATHLAEVFTTGVSGVSHLRLGNVNKRLFLALLLPGIIGALIGTYILSNVDGKLLKPFINAYLLLMGLYVLSKAFRHIKVKHDINPRRVAPLALFGGFMDTTGGGGWGPIVTTSLVGSGHDPRTTIGSVNFAEFFLTVTVATAFFTILDNSVWRMVAGLAIGGLFAAPLAAYITRHFKTKTLLILVGALISLVSAINIARLF
ncbi:sulfite exporter TauE/SafE family protein [Niveibacterium sp. 24ML]|uniref:sulfite exporter TauE/SafE family protein n=1 Tax=Niveibacterium sp. 24ML TaxID=2985512 RepID=UPI00226F20E6|nr:sulfite exporter TauE/SafE family protein [Niveibacterium sp. 24ML]MCX9157716.1 sulfite exporter TauE/SafE family protein [Niveibacterium sp. 24ML]